MLKFFKKEIKEAASEKPAFELELTAAVLAYEIARSDGEISADELSLLMLEIEKISNRMIVINKGRKVAEGEVNQLMSSDSIKIQIKTDSHTAIENYCKTHQTPFTNENESYYLQWEEAKINELIKSLNSENISLYEVRQLKTLEEYFLNLTN